MLSRIKNPLLSLCLGGALAACSAHHTDPGTALAVEASIASVTLGEDCTPAPGLRDPAGDCDSPGCGFACQGTTVQVAIDAEAGDLSVPFEVLSVRLLDMDGNEVDSLSARTGQVFDGEMYVDWDSTISPLDDLSIRFPTSSPDWTRIGGGDPWETYGMRFQVEMTVRIDGIERTLLFQPAMREAEIVT